MRVRSVSQRQSLGRACQSLAASSIGVLLSKVTADCFIIFGSHLKGLEGELAPDRMAHVAIPRFPSLHEFVVISRVRQHGYALVVFGSGAQESDTTNVDLLDCIGERAVGLRYSRSEGIKVANYDGYRGDRLSIKVLLIRRYASGKDTYGDGSQRSVSGFEE